MVVVPATMASMATMVTMATMATMVTMVAMVAMVAVIAGITLVVIVLVIGIVFTIWQTLGPVVMRIAQGLPLAWFEAAGGWGPCVASAARFVPMND